MPSIESCVADAKLARPIGSTVWADSHSYHLPALVSTGSVKFFSTIQHITRTAILTFQPGAHFILLQHPPLVQRATQRASADFLSREPTGMPYRLCRRCDRPESRLLIASAGGNN